MKDTLHGLVFAQKTDRGLRRAENEDACGYRTPDPGTPDAALGSLFVVADGVGGIGNGAEASQTAVETILSTYYDPELDDDDPRERLIAAVQDAHEAVLARARTLNVGALGTTLAGVLILAHGKGYLFNVGDSRVYRLREGRLEQLTVDDSAIDPQTMGAPKLTAYLGQGQPVVPNLFAHDLHPDDMLLICSDGLSNLMAPLEIAPVIQKYAPEKAIDLLMQTVYARGARDNITITIIRREKRSAQRLVLAAIALALLIGLCLLIQPLLAANHEESSRPMTLSSVAHASPQATHDAPSSNDGRLIIRTPGT